MVTLDGLSSSFSHMKDAVGKLDGFMQSAATLSDAASHLSEMDIDSLNSGIRQISQIDFETLNKAIQDLAGVIEPLARFAGRFS